MRFRDLFVLTFGLVAAILAASVGRSRLQDAMFASNEINREDATRESTTLLSADQWSEFQVAPGANSFRLLTNAALQTVDAPDHDLSNPRLGWRYAIEYELLDANRNLIQKAEYHFRSAIRQLLDVETGQPIYPLFFGKSSLVSTQTRTMQIAVNRKDGQQVSILRARLLLSDAQIQEVVARALARVERQDYGQRQTWNRMSKKLREAISRYCVYDHELLTIQERNSLLRWRWTRCPTLGEFEKRYLFFIGQVDDMEIRDEQLPMGFYTDPQTMATIPVPEGQGNVRLEFTRLDQHNDTEVVSIDWYGQGTENRKSFSCSIIEPVSNHSLVVSGGLLELQVSTRMVVRVFWQPHDDLARRSATGIVDAGQAGEENLAGEIEITPHAAGIRGFVADQDPVGFAISHYEDQPTPFRIQVRYPLGVLFDNEPLHPVCNDDPNGGGNVQGADDTNRSVTLFWHFHRQDGTVVDSGELQLCPEVSAYDWLTTNGMRELISDAGEFYFQVPNNVGWVSLTSPDSRLLVNGYVRPRGAQRKIRLPEDNHAFNRTHATNRSWFGLYPQDHALLIRNNRSFVVATQVRPPKVDDKILRGDYQWIRYTPTGSWIGRQLLIPKAVETELGVREESLRATYFELAENTEFPFREIETRFENHSSSPKLVFAADEPPGATAIRVNGQTVKSFQLSTRRGQLDLGDIAFPSQGTISIHSKPGSRFFLNGLHIETAHCFLKRTAQRLNHGSLEFRYTKTTCDDEMLTMRIYRTALDQVRCKVNVRIEPADTSENSFEQPQKSWTLRDRLYDLRPLNEASSLMLGNTGHLDAGHRCFIKLGKDLPVGDYLIRVDTQDSGKNSFVLLYQTIPGKQPIRNLRIQSIREARP